jgi:hypothetical protein
MGSLIVVGPVFGRILGTLFVMETVAMPCHAMPLVRKLHICLNDTLRCNGSDCILFLRTHQPQSPQSTLYCSVWK